ncbi:unnamed protein product [Hydatigera taeniaeformis]|uniref:Protein aurora borealis n=1 Tax=Hydatigena taeniaeformis TaxID=6205 RepID=A0A0R3WSV9_HYDTA|nr:unnamed protein product [Hydatigera taeniaeformis]
MATQNDLHLHMPQHPVSGFDEEENLPSSDSECPDTEGVKLLFLPNRITSSPVSSFHEPASEGFDNHSHLPYTDEMMAVYYSDPWRYYGRGMLEVDTVDEAAEEDHGEGFQLDDPPFGPISEEGEEEMGEMQQSFSDTSMTTTTSSTFEGQRPPSKSISRHLSLLGIPKIQRVLSHGYSYPLLLTIAPSENVLLPKVPRDMTDFVRCETVSPLKGDLRLDPVSVQGEINLRRAHVDEPPEIFIDSPFQQTYVTEGWKQNSPVEEESTRIIVAEEEDEDDDDDDDDDRVEGMMEDGEFKTEEITTLPQIRRCQHFENINQLIATVGSPLYPVMEEENGVESDPCLNSPVISDGQTIHRWGREISQAVSQRKAVNEDTVISGFF